MRRIVGIIVRAFALVGILALVALGWRLGRMWLPRAERPPDAPALVEKIREVARLETLVVRVQKKVTLEVDPPASDSLVGSLANWALWTIRPPVGRAIVFADVHVGLDIARIDERSLSIAGKRVDMLLPPVSIRVELLPGDTEIVRSNLDSARTAELLERGKRAIEADVAGDPALRRRAFESATRSLTRLFQSAGFLEVRFLEGPAPAAPTS